MPVSAATMRSDTLTKRFIEMGLIAIASGSSMAAAHSVESDLYQHSSARVGYSARSTSSSPTQSKINVVNCGAELIPWTAYRPTTQYERAIAELRSWHSFSENWDGEGALSPIVDTLKLAEKFTGLLDGPISAPEPMLNASGRAGLFWNLPALYADLEFYPDNRIAYYIEKNGDKHKGVATFQEEQLPTVFTALLESA